MVKVAGRACVEIDVAARLYVGHRRAPSRARNLRRDVLAAAGKLGARRVEHGGQVFLEIPEAR